ncbi:hypothetical protein OBK28_12215 [Empedobacter falsenii]
MSTYEDLLNDPRWKEKRQEILERDNHTCQRCGHNEKDKKLFTIIKLIELKFSTELIEFKLIDSLDTVKIIEVWHNNRKFITAKSFLNEEELKQLNINAQILFKDSSIDIRNNEFNGSLEFNNNTDHFKNFITNKAFINIFSNNDNFIDCENIWITPNFSLFQPSIYKEYFDSSLQVHHKCYRINYEIWDQPNEEYITLCNTCHKTVHTHQKIPFYDLNKKITDWMTPCTRCNGSRYISQYKHIKGGVCFKCKGSGRNNY